MEERDLDPHLDPGGDTECDLYDCDEHLHVIDRMIIEGNRFRAPLSVASFLANRAQSVGQELAAVLHLSDLFGVDESMVFGVFRDYGKRSLGRLFTAAGSRLSRAAQLRKALVEGKRPVDPICEAPPRRRH